MFSGHFSTDLCKIRFHIGCPHCPCGNLRVINNNKISVPEWQNETIWEIMMILNVG